jgi:hypothetical protein
MSGKTYEPEVIATYALPETGVSEESSQSNSYGKSVSFADNSVISSFPLSSVARELLSNTLNTKTKQILAEFKFGELGAIRIGNYENGVTGDISISPVGIVGRNSLGNTTFSIDGETGDAVFSGTVQAATIKASSYASADSGARVLIFPDANTGIVVYTTGGVTEVLKVEVGGVNVGDVTIGNYSGGNGALWDQSAGVLKIKGNMEAGSIDGVTITGSNISTGVPGETRVTMTDASDAINWYDSGDDIGLTINLVSSTLARIESKDGRALTLVSDSGAVEFSDNIDLNNHNLLNGGTINGSFVGDLTGNADTATTAVTATNLSGGEASMGGPIDMNGWKITEIPSLTFNDNSNTPANRELLMDDDGSHQRLRVHFANNSTQWQISLTDACTPVKSEMADPKYARKYNLMVELDDTRFKEKWPDTEEVQKEYRGSPKSHFPSMGNDGTAWKQHMEAMWKRPWLPMKSIPERLETMGQYPYPFVESPLIGESESPVNFYQLLAHSYNKVMERIEALEKRIK